MLCTTGEKTANELFSSKKKLKLNLSFALTSVETKYKPNFRQYRKYSYLTSSIDDTTFITFY